VIFVGILECIVDEFNRERWQPQMEGGKAGRELPGIVDQVISMSLFVKDGEGWRHTDPPRVRIISDNPLYSPYEGTAEEVNIIGRIRWFAREI
jgi:hypothetical protein